MNKAVVISILMAAATVLATNDAYVAPAAHDQVNKLDEQFFGTATPGYLHIKQQCQFVVEGSDRALFKSRQTSNDGTRCFLETESTQDLLGMLRTDM